MKSSKRAPSETEPRPRFVLDPSAAAEALAQAYYKASLNGANMAHAAELLECLRAEFSSEDYFHTWDSIDHWIGHNDDDFLIPILSGLRAQLAERVERGEIARLKKIYKKNPDQGWLEWLYALSGALVNWRGLLGRSLAAARLPFTPEQTVRRAGILRGYRAVQAEDWDKAMPLFDLLSAEESIPAVFRARINMFSAQVYLYHQLDFDRARQYLETASRLAADDVLVITGWGEYWLQKQDFDQARDLLRQAIRRDPLRSEPYCDMGDSYDRQNELDTAVEWYREAVKNNPGSSQGYVRLIRAFGRPELIGQYEAELDQLVKKAVAVDPESAGSIFLELAYIYQQNKRYGQAYETYDLVIQFHPDLVDGPVWKAYAQMEEGLYPEAQKTLEAALVLHPSSDTVADALEALALKYYTELGQDEPALRIYQLLREKRGKRYEMSYSNLVANLHYYHDDHAAAAEGYRRAVALRPKDAVLRSNLALALERLRVPGQRRKEISEAVQSLEAALEIDHGNEEYVARLDALRLEARLLASLGEDRLAQVPIHEPLTVYTSPDLVPRFADAEKKLLYPEFLEKVEVMRGRVQTRTGVSIPGIKFRDMGGSSTNYYYLCINEDWVEYKTMPAASVFVPAAPEAFLAAGLQGEREDTSPIDRPGFWVDEADLPKARAAGFEPLDPLDYMLAHLEAMARRYLPELDTLQSIYWRAAEALPDQIPALRAEPGKLVDLAVIFQALEAEGVPLRSFDTLLTEALNLRAAGLHRQEVVERLRALPALRTALPGSQPDARRVSLDPRLEDLLSAGLVESPAGPLLDLSRADFFAAGRLLPDYFGAGQVTAFVTARPGLRPHAARLLRAGLPAVPALALPVLAQTELPPEAAGQVSLPAAEAV